MVKKTHQTAIVLIPPQACWPPIQALRRQHDRQFRRWMPHITLVYPFRPREQFAGVVTDLRRVCAGVTPLEIRLGQFRHFGHGRGWYTLWLAPEPPEGLVRLQAGLSAVAPDCDDTARRGFTPHLSVGQVQRADRLVQVKDELQARWQPLSFVVREISLIWRSPPPDDIFRIDRTIALGVSEPGGGSAPSGV